MILEKNAAMVTFHNVARRNVLIADMIDENTKINRATKSRLTDMHSPSCNICGSHQWRSIDRTRIAAPLAFPGSLKQCLTCRVVCLSQMPAPATLEAYYSGQSYLAGFDTAGVAVVTEDTGVQNALRERLDNLANRLGKTGRLLDIGASRGNFLALARKQGWEVSGIEPGDEGVAHAKEQLQLELHHGSLETATFPEASFDVIHASHVLEHIPTPLQFLQRVYQLLRPGGILVIEVPAELGDLFTWTQQRILRLPTKAITVSSPHLYFYQPHSLSTLIKRSGFQIQKVSTPRRNQSMESRLPCGQLVKCNIYWVEQVLKWGPLIEVYATRQP